MTNTIHNKSTGRGFSTLLVTMVVLISAVIVSVFTAGAVVVRQKTIANRFHEQQAFAAAQAGVEYGIVYLDENKSTVTDGQVVTGSLSDGSSYSVQLDFIGGTNSEIDISSTGTSPGGTATHLVKQKVKYTEAAGGSAAIPVVPVQSRGSVDMAGNAKVVNLLNDNTITLGGTIDFNGNSKTTISLGTGSDSGGVNADVTQGDTTLAGMSDAELQTTYLGGLITDMQPSADLTYSNSSNHTYNSELNGQADKVIYITQSGGKAKISSNTVVGSAAEPVTIIVEGNFEISGNAIVHGNVIVTGSLKATGNSVINGLAFVLYGATLEDDAVTSTGNSQINGALISGASIDSKGNSTVTYSSSILNSTFAKIPSSGGKYGKVPGSWQDLGS
ncbi:MAG: hypothetical protein K0U12_05050 [Gammaproteobacteria bacterium]|nr:hypothetical protein [Gammaproteobacteria bacterium]